MELPLQPPPHYYVEHQEQEVLPQQTDITQEPLVLQW